MTTPRNLPAVQLMDLASDAWAIHDAARRSFIAQGAQGIRSSWTGWRTSASA